MFQTLTALSVPPVAMHPRMCGFTSSAETAPSCAESVNRAGDGELRSDGSVRASKLSTSPFSKETCGDFERQPTGDEVAVGARALT